ncbi:MAG TPA: ABC transporter ATP-binding protein [Desulfobacteraceae bacterium]|nr:ABC transporter ATP-binding protein [Desulfobacteraceae bacterium]
MVIVKNLVKKYGSVVASNHLNCRFETGKVTVILGGSGSGKSTLLRQVTGLEKPDSGEVLFDGLDLTRATREQLYEKRKKMGMLFQGAALFNYLTIFENIAFPLREHTQIADNVIKTIVTMKLEMVGLRGTEDLMPSQLSGGMMKRVGLARAIVMDPKIIFYDEPTSGLDPISTGVIDKLIRDLNRKLNITSVVVSHDIESCFRIADRIIILYYGDIIAEGTVEEIRNSTDPRVIQFINGNPEGPIPFTRTDKNYLDEILS